uniref:Phosphodiesterase n=2 Tax=Cacopsylla melanoneura TaxID=428564 RepID=A0A8D8SCE0_9HEMI
MSRSSSHTEQCGICSSVSLLFRRIMCIGATSRRGSDESYYYHHQHPHQTPGTAGVQETLLIERDIQVLVDSGGPAQSTISLHVPDSQEGCCLLVSRNVTQSEWALIDSHSTSIIPKTGRFLTMHKRRRKRLTTRSLCQDPALLDDIHHGQVECVLERVWKWPFNAFTLDNATGGRSLPVLCVHLFHWYGLMEHFSLDVVRVWKLFSLIEEGYHGTNPYHNSIHATDVTQAMHCFLQEEKIKRHLTHLEIMASLLAAVAHDLDHPGVNQPFLIATSNHLAALYEVRLLENHLAALYENTSVLENHHWRSAVGCLLESNVAEQLGSIRPELERQISSLILATDITRQQEFLTRFKAYLDSKSLDMSLAEHRHFILQIALKCADISNPCRPWEVSKKWSQKVCEEFFRQGDYERQLNLPVTSLCDRYSTSIPKIQTGFFKFVVFPLFEEWHRFLSTPLSTSMMGHLRGNQSKWDAMLATELAEETKTEISDAEEVNLEDCVDLDRRASLPAVMLETVDRMGRRHSVPINFAGNEINVPVLGGGRRESLPASAVVERGARRFAGVQERHLEEEEEDEEEDSDSGNEERNRNNKTNTTTTTTSGIGSSNDLDDMSPQIPSSCDQHIVPQELIDYYVKMFHCGTDQNENSDLARHCAFSLPAVALTLGSPNWSLLRPVTKRLACDEHWKVRRMVAASMHELAVIVGPGAATRDLLPVYTDLIKDLDEVRIGALRILSRFLYLLKPEGRLKFLPMFNKFLATDYEWNWRFRAEFVTQLGLSLGYFLPQQIWDYLAPLALLLLSDKVAAVRRVAVDLMDELFVHLSPSLPLTRCLTTTLAEDFAHSTSWSQRQTFASLCARLVTPPSAADQQDGNCSDGGGGGGMQSLSFGAGGADDRDDKGASQQRRSSTTPSLPYEVFALDILPHLIHLARDPVPNVRLCVARTLALNVAPLAYFQPPCPHAEVILETLHTLMNDPDADVQYYASQKPDPSPSNEHNTTANTTDTDINRSHTTEDSSSSSSGDSSSPTSKKMMRTQHYNYFDDDEESGPVNNSAWDPTIKQHQSETDERDQVDSSRVPKTEDEDKGSSSDEEEEDSNCVAAANSSSSSDANNSQQLRRRSRPAGQQEATTTADQQQTSSSSSENQPPSTTAAASPSASPTSSNVTKIPPPLPVDSPRPRGNRQQQQQQQSNARKRQRN